MNIRLVSVLGSEYFTPFCANISLCHLIALHEFDVFYVAFFCVSCMRPHHRRATAGPAETTLPHTDTDNICTSPLVEQDETMATGGATKQTLMNNNSDDSAIATWDDHESSLDSILDKNANDSLYVLEFPFDGLDEEDDISESLSGKLEADCGAGAIFFDSLAWGLVLPGANVWWKIR